MKKSKFGRPSLDHTFTSQATFEHILIFLLKGEYLPNRDKKSLFNTHPLFRHFNNILEWSRNIKFMDLKNPIKDYANQNSINTTRIKKMLAAVFWYNLDIPTVIRFLGNNYMGEYRDINKTLQMLRDTKCDPQVIKELGRLFSIGAPNKFNASSTQQKLLGLF